MDIFSKSTVTWPRSQIPVKILAEMKKWNLPNVLKSIKTRGEELENEEIKQLVDEIGALCLGLRTRNASITSDFVDFKDIEQKNNNHVDSTEVEIIDQFQNFPSKSAQIFTFIFIVFLFFNYLLLGTVIFQELDPGIGNKTFFKAFMLPLQTCLTIGWGNLPILTANAQLFCIFYAILGVPLCHTTITRIGQALYTSYVPDWILNSAALRHIPGKKEKIVTFPLFSAIKYLCVFHIVGLVLFNGYIANFGIVESLYFNFFTSAFIGFGDIIPDPANPLQTFALFLYLPCGGIFQAVVHACGSYHVQRLFYVIFKNWLYNLHLKKIGAKF